ncbi:cupin domain-containing protein [Carboxylicivirga marina]|uniref:Cupin domain-containing protein n=1 Tax=Carboxylicivirga marina TaxID=2800988 RepID=A0ABS1HHH0_9BACT|nr:cupin domain-containing protein [Carboxylicivirga marina]MBK3517134.1 cupin domain-containing protein [Carboxylicivirga marina]
MHYKYSNKTKVLDSEITTGYLLASTNQNDIVELHIDASGIVPAHALPIDVTFYVSSGSGTLILSNEEIIANTGDIIHVDKDLERSWENKGNASLKLLVIKQKVSD